MPRILVWPQKGDSMKLALDMQEGKAKDFSVSETLIAFSDLDASGLQPFAESLYEKAGEFFDLRDKRKFTSQQFLEFRSLLYEALREVYKLGELYGNLTEAEFCDCGPFYWTLDRLLQEQRDDYFGTCAAIQKMFEIGFMLGYFFLYVNAWVCEGLEEYMETGTLSPAHSVCQAEISLFFDKEAVMERYEFKRAREFFSFLLIHLVKNKTPLRKCAYCGRLFVPLSKKHTKYCERVQKNGKSCMELGPANRHRKAVEKDPVFETYDRVRRRMYKRMERAQDGFDYGGIQMGVAAYFAWRSEAEKIRQQYIDGEISAEEAIKTLKPDETKRPTPVEYDF